MIRRALCVLAILASASPAAAQGAIQFFPRYDFHVGAEHLSQDDPRFVWDTNFGGEMDFVDYGIGRITFATNYEAVLGEEIRNFDPNQGNYLLDLSTSVRVRGYEFAAILHHLSRHLSDRDKRLPLDWNMAGVAFARDALRRGTLVRVRGDLLGVLLKSNVDYSWEANGAVQVRVPVRDRVSMISGGALRFVGVDGQFGRGTQNGGRAEAGVRIDGERGALELIVAAERRIDAYPFEITALSWVSAGFRFVSR